MKYLLGAVAVLMTAGCGFNHPPEKIVAKVGAYVITQDEFEEAFQLSSYSKDDSPELRQAYLNTLINQKLVILDAQARGMDKDRVFLSMIQKYWEQSLLTLALRDKSTKDASHVNQWIEELRRKATIETYPENIKAGL